MSVATEGAAIEVGAPEEYAPFVVEQRGIDHIPVSDRHTTPSLAPPATRSRIGAGSLPEPWGT